MIILRAPYVQETVLREYLSRLVITVEVGIVNEAVPGHKSPPGSDSIFQGALQDVSDPFIIKGEEDEPDSEKGDKASVGRFIHAAWKLPIFLARPRIRLHNPSVIFTASVALKPDALELMSKTGYLPTGVPSSLNLLESFSNDPSLNGIQPRLSALRVARVAPVTRSHEVVQHIQALPNLRMPIFPVVHARIRFSRPSTAPISSSVVAVLEVDFTPFFEVEVTLDKIQLSVPDSTIQSLDDADAMQLPLMCVAHDHITLLYHITSLPQNSSLQHLTRDLSISIAASVQIESEQCVPRLNMSWTASVDFTTPVNPGFGPNVSTGSIQRSHRPSQLSISGGQAVTPLKSPSLTRPDALPALEATAASKDVPLPDLGITLSFTAPSHPVKLGETFSWSVYVVNRTSERNTKPPRKLALVAIPKRHRNDNRNARPPSLSSRRGGEKEIADAVLDENVLNAIQKNAVLGSTDVICLSADTRIGPLAPGSCHAVELQFLALREGIVGVEAIRVIDLVTQEHVDIRDLPTTFVEPAAA